MPGWNFLLKERNNVLRLEKSFSCTDSQEGNFEWKWNVRSILMQQNVIRSRDTDLKFQLLKLELTFEKLQSQEPCRKLWCPPVDTVIEASVQFSSIQSLSHVRLCNPMDCSIPGFLVCHQLPESAQTHVHRVSDTIQPSHPLSSPSPPAFSLFQHQGLFQGVSTSHQVAKVLELQLQHQSLRWIFRTNFL